MNLQVGTCKLRQEQPAAPGTGQARSGAALAAPGLIASMQALDYQPLSSAADASRYKPVLLWGKLIPLQLLAGASHCTIAAREGGPAATYAQVLVRLPGMHSSMASSSISNV